MDDQNTILEEITVDIERLDKIYEIAKESGLKQISFEYLVGSCFPKVLENIKEEMRLQYTLGFIAGQGILEEEEIDFGLIN